MGFELSDLNPFTWPGQVADRLKHDYQNLTNDPTADQQRADLNRQGQAASDFAQFGENGYGAMTNESAAFRDALRRRASGENSISNEQLRQGLQQQLAQQRSMAASASPQNAAMAARTAAINMGRASSAMSGQAAMARLQEQKDAEAALGAAIYGQRGQDLQAALESRRNSVTAYGGAKPEGSTLDKVAGPAASAFAAAARLFSDRRLKTDIEDGDDDANDALDKLKPHTFRYKNEKHGKGEQLGIMAQDLERAGLKSAIVETKEGKAIDAAKLSGANTAMLAAMARRVAKLEADRDDDAGGQRGLAEALRDRARRG